ncbi:tRNA-modifying protein YgfZ [Grimontia hollisae]|uniref:tRNA-modifying protein YgfZ n=2 Tax=Grimontia hollisae TaxID=673 RepID=D0I4N1_GRIHO|nr:tRNA-modifying protein YgfZ [Grimontia hollisae]AMG30156.1 tRNA-modifying protein YgfZ [Grimontia hollisae]EEY73448.1 glycine cleavage T-protein [Grimontia hollisae CIP 101886]MDF2184554.1 tRNA-modifying protein YgfZ [Grimontia hollisae]STO42599.1 tRNA-modifying protein ygfZ [Grimontia hollisae]STO56482.1 tRNA-modifying protein ygfZ [Grimontia hollisae]
MTNWYQTHAFHRLPLSSDSALPALSVIALDHLALITAVGQDTIPYLQGQLTCDLVSLEKTRSTLAAHCDAKGKVWSAIRIFHHGNGVAYVQPASVAEKQLAEIKKYAVFSKTEFTLSEQVLIGIAGEKANNAVESRFIGEGDVRPTQTGTAVRIDGNRWLLAIDKEEADTLITELGERATLSDNALWTLLDLRAALPAIEDATTNEFIPQALNLQALDGISFKKGCYTGQETVARAKYRGINKRATYLLQGKAEDAPKAGDVFDRSVGENWRTGGTVLTGYRFEDGQALALVVLPNNLDDNSQFRLPETDTLWQKVDLPYSLEDDA